MKAKEKAEELIRKFSPLVTTWDCYWDTPRNDDDICIDATKCAIIAVQEIINFIDNDCPVEVINESLDYWHEVKNHLTNHNHE